MGPRISGWFWTSVENASRGLMHVQTLTSCPWKPEQNGVNRVAYAFHPCVLHTYRIATGPRSSNTYAGACCFGHGAELVEAIATPHASPCCTRILVQLRLGVPRLSRGLEVRPKVGERPFGGQFARVA